MGAEDRPLMTELVAVIEDYNHTQLELLKCVRQLRANMREAVPFLVGGPIGPSLPTSPPSTEPAGAPTGMSAYSSSSIAPPSKGWTWTISRSTLANGRDYDYFAGLDQKIAELEARLAESIEIGEESDP